MLAKARHWKCKLLQKQPTHISRQYFYKQKSYHTTSSYEFDSILINKILTIFGQLTKILILKTSSITNSTLQFQAISSTSNL